MNILVIGGTGLVGSHVVQGLVAKGEQVHVLTRSADKADVLPLGASGIIGDLHKPETLRWAMRGIDRMCLVTPLSPTETEEGLATVAAARRAGVRHLVYLSVYHVEQAPHIPHFKSKMEIQKALRNSGMAFTLIMANNFFQSDLVYRESILEEGVYLQPIGDIGINRVDVRDIADEASAQQRTDVNDILGELGVDPERLALGVELGEAGVLRVPDPEHAVVAAAAEHLGLLGAPHRGRGELLVQPGLEADLRGVECAFRLPEREVVAAERRAAVTRDEAGGVQAGARVAAPLLERQAHQRLDAGEKDRAALERVTILERDRAQRPRELLHRRSQARAAVRRVRFGAERRGRSRAAPPASRSACRAAVS